MQLPSVVYTNIQQAWQNEALEGLKEFIRLPAVSRSYDPEWKSKGMLLKALTNAEHWCRTMLPQARIEILSEKGIPPALFIHIPAFKEHLGQPAFYYGHLDKQPPAGAWASGLSPWSPVEVENRLYGRGSVDDGYNFFLCLTAIKALEDAGIPHPGAYLLFETDEESGSYGLSDYIRRIAPKVGNPAFIAIADLDCMNFSRVWLTQSLRGSLAMTVRVRVLKTPAHSGMASGIVPSSFRIMRSLLNRIEDPDTGDILLPELNADIPEDIKQCLHTLSRENDVRTPFNWAGSTQSSANSAYEALLTNTWKPSLCITGADGLPSCSEAGNVLRTETTLRLSLRTPPTIDADAAIAALKKALTTNVPYQAEVDIFDVGGSSGFISPLPEGWLLNALNSSSERHFSQTPGYVFCGASIGTLPAFKDAFPSAPFVNTGALGPGCNAHAPNEWLNLPYTVKLTCIFADLLAAIPQENS